MNIPPLQALREVTAALGLTRKNNGRLLLTLAGRKTRRDPLLLWGHISSRIPVERATAKRDIATLGLLLAAAGVQPDTSPFGDALNTLVSMAGWQTRSGVPFDAPTLFFQAELTGLVLEWATTGVLVEGVGTGAGFTESGAALLARTAFSR